MSKKSHYNNKKFSKNIPISSKLGIFYKNKNGVGGIVIDRDTHTKILLQKMMKILP
jgi:hypothetical protein